MINYLLHTITISGLFIIFYMIFLKQEKIFVFNRFYLLFSLVLALVLPFITIRIVGDYTHEVSETTHVFYKALDSSSYIEDTTKTMVLSVKRNSVGDLFFYLYLIVSVLFIIRFFRNIMHLFSNTSNRYLNGMKVIKVAHTTSAYSFFKYLFLPLDYDDKPESYVYQIEHELIHYRQKHSIDVICVELLKCMLWCNPFIWLYAYYIRQNHEYLADENVLLDTKASKYDYIQNIVVALKNQYSNTVVSGFNFHQSKNRIVMLQKSKSGLLTRMSKVGFVLALVAVVFILSSFRIDSKPVIERVLPRETIEIITSPFENITVARTGIQIVNNDLEEISNANFKSPVYAVDTEVTPIENGSKTFVVLIDAGHGGKDLGNSIEKNINLAIAKEIAALSNDDVKVVLSREDDTFVSLQDRVVMANELKPNLFLSLHCNSGNGKVSGMELYFSDKNLHFDISKEYSLALLNTMLEKKMCEEISLKKANFVVLKETEVPSVMLELGFLTNEKDKAKLTNGAFQKELAQSIFSSLEKIATD